MQTTALNPGSLEPLTVDELKTYARVASGDIEDALIQTLIGSARAQCEEFARIAISPRQWQTSYRVPTYSGYGMGLGGNWHDPENVVKGLTVPRAPVQSVDVFEWRTHSGLETVDPNVWVFDPSDLRIRWLERFELPPSEAFSLLVTYTAGYPPDNEDPQLATICVAPDPIKTAVMIQATHMYENRASENEVMMPKQVVELLRGFWRSASIA